MSYGIKSAAVNATADGENEIVAAVAGKTIEVIGFCLTAFHASAAAEIDLRSGTSNTVHARFQSGLAAALSAISLMGSVKEPLFLCDVGDSLVINNGTGVDTKGIVIYRMK
jgi:hypothetical protein